MPDCVGLWGDYVDLWCDCVDLWHFDLWSDCIKFVAQRGERLHVNCWQVMKVLKTGR